MLIILCQKRSICGGIDGSDIKEKRELLTNREFFRTNQYVLTLVYAARSSITFLLPLILGKDGRSKPIYLEQE